MITNKDIKQYKYLVYKIVNKYRTRTFKYKTNIDWDEMEQVGFIALYKALKNYNPDKGSSFMNYAIISIARAIIRQEKFYRVLENESDIEDFMYGLSDDSLDNIEDNLDYKIILERTIKAINKAPILQRSKDITIARLKGLTNAEIAKRYNVSPQAISQVYLRVIGEVKNKIQGGKNANRE